MERQKLLINSLWNTALKSFLADLKIDIILVTLLNLEDCIIRHNQKSKGFTSNVNDWKVVYLEKHETKN